jgi:type II secretory pathway pseudopilin PulG
MDTHERGRAVTLERNARQGGFTLLEVVAATVLLSALTIALLPTLVDATVVAHRTTPTVDARALGAFVDGLLADEKTHARIEDSTETRFAWDDSASHASTEVVATRREFGEGSRRHNWVEFRYGDVRVLRFVSRRPQQQESGDEEGAR